MLIGYARVSTGSQNLESQIETLRSVGCEKILKDSVSGTLAVRPGLDSALELLRKSDVLIVTRLDRLGRTMKHLIKLVTGLKDQGVGFRSLSEGFDTTTNGGQLIFHMFSAIAEFERNLIVERVNTGLKSARARGRVGGRPGKLSEKQLDIMFDLYDSGKQTVAEICKSFKISRTSFYNNLTKRRCVVNLKNQNKE